MFNCNPKVNIQDIYHSILSFIYCRDYLFVVLALISCVFAQGENFTDGVSEAIAITNKIHYN